DLKNNFHEHIKKAQKIKIYTTIKILQEGEEVVASYELSDQLARIVGDKVVDYLRNFELMLDNSALQTLTIYKVFHSWPNCAKYLEAESLKDYFGEDTHTFDPSILEEESLENFIKAEERMIDRIVDKSKFENAFYQPVPIEENGKFLGITYLIYNMTQMDEEEKGILEKFQTLLKKRYA
ncbi:MAG: hypothetical protein AAF135_16520, partial [Bacteroidota bacterium]